MIDLPDNLHDLIEEASERFEQISNKVKDTYSYIENKQPENFSWITFDACYVSIATDSSTGIIYKDNNDFRKELHKYIDAYFSDDIVNLYREGRLTELMIMLGAQKHNGENINEELGLDDVHKNKQKKP